MLGNEVIYQIFPRNYSKEGTFYSIEKDLPRIKDLGVDIIYLMPIHKIGIKNRKGTYGSPYAIKDYFSISEDLGTIDDFKSLIVAIHKLGIRIILDMVFNHTSPDNILLETHPEYYFYKNGRLGNRVGDWSDIVDLDVARDDTQNYLLDVLKYWISLGVDGFRFDVASMIPLSFFKKARQELGKDIIFIGESIDFEFANYLNQIGDHPTADDEMFPTFDCLYNYSWFNTFDRYLKNETDLAELVKALNEDEVLLKNGIRMNCMENHDRDRIALLAENRDLKQIISFFSFIKGQLFIYASQEYGVTHKPELFEKDPIDWIKNDEILSIYKTAIKEKKSQKDCYKTKQRFSLVDKTTIEVTKYIDDQIIDKRLFKF